MKAISWNDRNITEQYKDYLTKHQQDEHVSIFLLGEPNYGIPSVYPKTKLLRLTNKPMLSPDATSILEVTPEQYGILLFDQNLLALETLVTPAKQVSNDVQQILTDCQNLLEMDIRKQCQHAQEAMNNAYEQALLMLESDAKDVTLAAAHDITITMRMSQFLRTRLEGKSFGEAIRIDNPHLLNQLTNYRNGLVADPKYLKNVITLAVAHTNKQMHFDKHIDALPTASKKQQRQAKSDIRHLTEYLQKIL